MSWGVMEAVLVADSLSPERNREPNGPKRHVDIQLLHSLKPMISVGGRHISYGHPLKELLLYFAAN